VVSKVLLEVIDAFYNERLRK